MSLPTELQQLTDRYNDLVAQYNAGHISEEDATSLMAATSYPDGDGAIWSVAPMGHFLRAARPGDNPEPADYRLFIDPHAPRAPTPAFPAPASMFHAPVADLDTPPVPHHAPAQDWAQSSPAVGMVLPPGEPTSSSKSLANDRGPRAKPVFIGRILGFFAANKVFAVILVVGALIIGAALIVPSLTSDEPSAAMPTSAGLPGEELPAEAPAVTSEAPSALDAANVATALQSGTPEQIQALISVELDAVTLLRTQALWAGVAQSAVTITPQAAAAVGDGTSTQKWSLTRQDQSEPVTSIDVTWVNDGTTWKLTAPPTF